MLEGECSPEVPVISGVPPEVPVTPGVPQGSVLGQLFFLLYIHDLPADNIAVYLTVDNQNDSTILQNDLDTIQEWERTCDMEFNPREYQVLHISRARQSVSSQYILHGETLESVNCVRYLWVRISKDLTWNTHIKEILSKAYRTLGFVKRNVKISLQNLCQT